MKDIEEVSMDRYLTRKEVADRLRVTPETVSDWIRDGKLKAEKVGKKLLITEKAVLDAVEAVK